MEHHRAGTVVLACGKGKTVLALRYISKRRRPAIVVVNQTALLEQWKQEIVDHMDDVKIGVMSGNSDGLELSVDILLTTVQTLARRAPYLDYRFRKRFGVSIFDEGHHLSAPYFVRSADLFYGDRFSLTATPKRADKLEMIYQYHLGPVIHENLSQDLIPDTNFVQLRWTPTEDQLDECRDVTGTTHHRKLCRFLGTLNWRNDFIVDKIQGLLHQGRQLLVLSHSIDHTRALFDRCGPQASLINGEDVKDPLERINRLHNGNPVIATFDLAREALNKKTLDCLVITTPFSSSNDFQQSWGRIQRHHDGKNVPVVLVIEDAQIKMCHEQCNQLRKLLKGRGYPFEIQVLNSERTAMDR
jgi:superfamily II DNA or RNA helicase